MQNDGPAPNPRLPRTPANLLKTAWYRYVYRRLPGATVSIYGIKLYAQHYRMLERAFVIKEYERFDLNAFGWLFPKDGVFIDVGANIGMYSLYAALWLNPSVVVAVEPSSREALSLLFNLRLNRCQEQVQVVSEACSNTVGAARLLVAKGFHRGGNAIDRFYYSDTPLDYEMTVRTTTIDALVNGMRLKRVDFIKIDTDGHEHQVIEGAMETLSRFRPVLAIEYPAQRTIELLRTWGYEPLEKHPEEYNTIFKAADCDGLS